MNNKTQWDWLKATIHNYISQPFNADLVLAICEAGEQAKNADRTSIKSGAGHRSVVAKADMTSTEYILSALAHFPDAKILCEENSDDVRVLQRKDPKGLLDCETGCVFDPLDGSARSAGKFPDWCVAGASLYKGHINGSAIYAPDANGGTLLFASGGLTACCEAYGPPTIVPKLSSQPSNDCVILRGVDTELYANMLKIMPKVAAGVRAVYTEGSGLFGLMYVALGRAAAIIQSPQRAWDWVPAYHALTNVNGAFQFFRLIKGNLVPVGDYDFDAFVDDPEKRLGFVAGEPEMVGKLFAQLPRTGWERQDPYAL